MTRDVGRLRPEILGQALLLLCVVIWGINAVAFKVALRPSAVGQAGIGFDAPMLNGLRFLVVAPIMAAMVAWRRPSDLRIDGRDAARFAIYGFVAIAFGETVLTQALQYTAVANMSLLGPGTISLFTAVWAAMMGEQSLTRIGWTGAAVAFLGVGVVAGSGPGGFAVDPQSLIGDALALLRSAMHALYLLFLARTLRERPAMTATVWNIVFGALWFLPYVVWRAPQVQWSRVPSVVWGALAWTIFPTTLFGFAAWNWTMRRVGAVSASNVMFLLPFTGAAAAWAILGEPLRIGQVLGGAVIVAGIVLLRWDAVTGVRR